MSYRYEEWMRTHLNVRSSSGEEFACLCPIHDDRSPSFSMNAATGLYFCHGCHERGGIARLAKLLDTDAPKGSSSIATVRNRIQGMREPEKVQFQPDTFLSNFAYPTAFWSRRGLNDATIEEWELGFDPAWIAGTMPLRDSHGRLLGVARRALKPKPGVPKVKYPLGFKKTEHLFGLHLIKKASRKSVLVAIEGQIDAMLVRQAGYDAVSIMGGHPSAHQLSLIRRLPHSKVVLFGDNDTDGLVMVSELRAGLMDSKRLYTVRYDNQLGTKPGDAGDMKKKKVIRNVIEEALAA
jgi:5S rRNA maturation endonuclease (ribonuclease M5)